MASGNSAKPRVDRMGSGNDIANSIVEPGKLILFDKNVTFSNVGGAVEFGSVALCGLPAGFIVVVGGFIDLDILESPAQANISQTYNVTAALGTTATADNALATTEINLMTAAAAGAATAGVSPHIARALDGIATLAGATGAAAGYINNSAGTGSVFLNLTLPDADISGVGVLRCRGALRLCTVGFGKH